MFVDQNDFFKGQQPPRLIEVSSVTADRADCDLETVVSTARRLGAHLRRQVPSVLFDVQGRHYDAELSNPVTYLECMDVADYSHGYEHEAVEEFNRQIVLLQDWAHKRGVAFDIPMHDCLFEMSFSPQPCL